MPIDWLPLFVVVDRNAAPGKEVETKGWKDKLMEPELVETAVEAPSPAPLINRAPLMLPDFVDMVDWKRRSGMEAELGEKRILMLPEAVESFRTAGMEPGCGMMVMPMDPEVVERSRRS
jgi:hypothetical protein